ncbi:NADPH-dependent 7-cyano-7-deazaguanine reductase QueF [uncultured Paraglaciecola sp.]|uniref:NADPH-dependent 7-cyano-7-deazaguanine reductase QueF n=1 Tax=uncultured Paraglaciecola sp. TaxID=1765024 RepID=UPI0025993BB2|nr:NADPH-dependent 7-cyano-7-deazaguanine reductase QueF [uncultured Paraglaciecola sp.]
MNISVDKEATLASLGLGKKTEYLETYTPSLLQSVPRSMNRDDLNLPSTLPFHGCDRWNGYELSWLNPKGKPQVAILQCDIPATTPNLIESKSFKLYLNSFNQSIFSSRESVQDAIQKDLSNCVGDYVTIKVLPLELFTNLTISSFSALNIDDLDIEIDNYKMDSSTLYSGGGIIEEKLCSNLLKSNCLITNQPDWGSVYIHYIGPQINHEGLLKYLISFRQHNEFHEQCVERIFWDIMRQCKPSKLTVYARYTRRGGLDINPFRSNFENISPEQRNARQ